MEMDKAKELILKLEVQEYLKEKSKEVVIGMKENFPILHNVNIMVTINAWINPLPLKKK